MKQGPAQEYVQAELFPSDAASIDWQHQPCQFKLYTDSTQISLPYKGEQNLHDGSWTLGQIGALLADLYGLMQQYQVVHAPVSETALLTASALMIRRAVPSGGSRFPCEIYLFVRDEYHIPAGIYHYDVAHHALDLLQAGDALETACSHLAHPGLTQPACMIALSCFFWKDGFKYGEFSYRLQGFDLGTVIAQCMTLLNTYALPSTVHYQFLDPGINNLLGLDPLYESIYALIAIDQVKQEQFSPADRQHQEHALADVKMPTAPKLTSVAYWPLVEAVHRAACYETREQFRDLCCLPAIAAPASQATYALPADELELDLLARYQQRHSASHFLPLPISTQQLAQLCRLSFAGYQNDVDGQSMTLQHTMLYCLVNRVEGIPAGIYYYDPHKYTCELVAAGDRRKELQALQRDQLPNVHNLSVCFFAVGDYTSGFQQYGDRWYRMQNMEAGIVVQRLYLAAEALHLGCRASLSFDPPAAQTLLSLPENWHALIQVMIGLEAPQYEYYRQSLRF